MKQITAGLFSLLFIFCSIQGISQKKAGGEKTMPWTTKSQEAKNLASQGVDHFLNIELPQAYQDFMASLKLDPDFTIPLVFMANLSTGEAKKIYIQGAIKSAANKTEGEKLFASVVAEGNTPEENRAIWARLVEMFPDGSMIRAFYVNTRETPDERFATAEEYIQQFPDKAFMYNYIAYMYMNDKKDMRMAKQNFEKYIELYPEGSNPYDSMGEYYLTVGDTENAKKYYSMALEKYPFNNSSLTALQKLNESGKTQVKN
jgi:tetratricopeptide (TPR) repeat protein